MTNSKKIKLPSDQFRVLRSIYEWRFVGREVAAGKASGRLQSFERIPAYLIYGEFLKTSVDILKVLQILELKGLIQPVGVRLYTTGAWILPSGRVLSVEEHSVESSPGIAYFGRRIWLFVDDELVDKRADSRTLELTKEGFALVENMSKTRALGESVEALRKRAERYVTNHGNEFPGVNELARRLECAPSSLSKAIKASIYLRARQAEHNKEGKKARKTSLTNVVLDNAEQCTEAAEQLTRLIAEQEAERRSDHRIALHSRPHS